MVCVCVCGEKKRKKVNKKRVLKEKKYKDGKKRKKWGKATFCPCPAHI